MDLVQNVILVMCIVTSGIYLLLEHFAKPFFSFLNFIPSSMRQLCLIPCQDIARKAWNIFISTLPSLPFLVLTPFASGYNLKCPVQTRLHLDSQCRMVIGFCCVCCSAIIGDHIRWVPSDSYASKYWPSALINDLGWR